MCVGGDAVGWEAASPRRPRERGRGSIIRKRGIERTTAYGHKTTEKRGQKNKEGGREGSEKRVPCCTQAYAVGDHSSTIIIPNMHAHAHNREEGKRESAATRNRPYIHKQRDAFSSFSHKSCISVFRFIALADRTVFRMCVCACGMETNKRGRPPTRAPRDTNRHTANRSSPHPPPSPLSVNPVPGPREAGRSNSKREGGGEDGNEVATQGTNTVYYTGTAGACKCETKHVNLN